MTRMIVLVAVILIASHAVADELAIIDIRRNITLADSDPVYKDFYINAGDGSGLKKDLVVTAVRKISVRDASGAQAYGEILVPVGQLKILAMYGRLAVAREFTLLSRDDLPMLEQIGIMTGDRIDLQGAFIDTSKPKRKVSSESQPFEMTVTTTSTVVPLKVTDTPLSSAKAAAPVPLMAKPVVDASQVTPAVATKSAVPVATNAASAEVVSPAPASVSAPQKLEKTADSGNTTEE